MYIINLDTSAKLCEIKLFVKLTSKGIFSSPFTCWDCGDARWVAEMGDSALKRLGCKLLQIQKSVLQEYSKKYVDHAWLVLLSVVFFR